MLFVIDRPQGVLTYVMLWEEIRASDVLYSLAVRCCYGHYKHFEH